MRATAEQQNKIEPVKPDSYHAVCYGVVDIGTEYSEVYKSESRKAVILWELPDETYEKDGKKIPRTVNKKYTLSLADKANLNHDLTGWRGAAFTEEEIKSGFELNKLLTQNCILTIVSSNGGKSSKVQSVSKMMKTMIKKQPYRKVVYYDIDEHGKTIPEGLQKWIVEAIQKSPECKALDGAMSQSDTDAIDNLPVDESDNMAGEGEDNTEIPF
jgi:hypothetical protein